jgi:hypothetical protein
METMWEFAPKTFLKRRATSLEKILPEHGIRRSMRTHRDLTDPRLRTLLARELLTLRFRRKQAAQAGRSFDETWVWGIRVGLETALRRVQAANLLPVETSRRNET